MRRLGWTLVVAFVLVAGLYVAGGREIAAIERAYPPVGTFVPVPGGRLQVLDLGRDNAANGTVVLLHGANSNLQEMALGLGRRLATRFRVIAIDRPGHGWSDRPGGRADGSPARQAILIAAALDRLDVSRAVIVGHSWGGTAALALALDAPRHVGGLVLIAAASQPDLGRALAWSDRAGLARVFASDTVDRILTPLGALLLPFGTLAVFTPTPVPANFIHAAAVPLMLRPHQIRADAEDLSSLRAYLRGARRRYGTIRVPTVIITGDTDGLLDAHAQSGTLARQIHGARLVVMKGVGHMPQYADPERVVAEIARVVGAVTDDATPVPPATGTEPAIR